MEDVTLTVTGEWRLAIDLATLSIQNYPPKTNLPREVWATGAQPVTLTAQACRVGWEVVNNAATAPPMSPVVCIGDARFNVTLAPFGAAKVRLGEIPVMA